METARKGETMKEENGWELENRLGKEKKAS
jgi:hypothetical protein